MNFRIEIQDMVWHLGCNTSTNENEGIEQKWQTLGSMLTKLRQMQEAANVITIPSSGLQSQNDNEAEFDDVVELVSANEFPQLNQATHHHDQNVVEREVVSLPSSANIIGEPAQVEIHQRKWQACQQIVQLRDIIANISFQYSHVIRGAI